MEDRALVIVPTYNEKDNLPPLAQRILNLPVKVDLLVVDDNSPAIALYARKGFQPTGEMATMAKNHPNVYIECGWLAYIAPAVYRRAMGEWLDAVPASKLLGFSADCAHVEQTLGALILTRRQLARALAEKVRSDDWSTALAENVGRRVLYQNARDLYRLDGDDEGGERID